MKIKTSELKDLALDWAVANGAGILDRIDLEQVNGAWELFIPDLGCSFEPSLCWTQGGPIIELEGITISKTAHGFWEAYRHPASLQKCYQTNNLPLIAAMRCYVQRKLGDDVEIPEELV